MKDFKPDNASDKYYITVRLEETLVSLPVLGPVGNSPHLRHQIFYPVTLADPIYTTLVYSEDLLKHEERDVMPLIKF